MAGPTETSESYFDCEKPRIWRSTPVKYLRPSRREKQRQPDFIRKTVDPWTSFQGIHNYVGHLDNLPESRTSVRNLQKDQVGLPEFNVSYSLNKKGRWVLPKIMQRDIEAYQDVPNQLRVSLIQGNDDAQASQQPELFQPIRSYHTHVNNEPVHKIAKRGNAKAMDFMRPENPAKHRQGRLLKIPENGMDLFKDKNFFNSPMEDDLDSWERNAHVVYTTYSLKEKPKTQKIAKGSKKDKHYDFDYDYELEDDFKDNEDESDLQGFKRDDYRYSLDHFLVSKGSKKNYQSSETISDLDFSSVSSEDSEFVFVSRSLLPAKLQTQEFPLIFEIEIQGDDNIDFLGLFGKENVSFCEGVKPETYCVKLTEASATTLKFMTDTKVKMKEGDLAVVVSTEKLLKATKQDFPQQGRTCPRTDAIDTFCHASRENVLPAVLSPEKLLHPQNSFCELEGRDVVLSAIFASQPKTTRTNLSDCCLQCGSTSVTCFSLACGHLFCRDCARSHVLTEDKLPITCSFPDCPVMYTPDVLKSVVGLKFVEEYCHKLVEKRLKLPDFQRCFRCERINHFPNDGLNHEGYGMCLCGEVICRKCGKECHAPLSCEKMDFYESILTRKGHTFHSMVDMSDFIREINAVICPSCTYPVERYAGCDHMTCWCGYEFCYRCGQGYKSSPHLCGEKQGLQTFEIDVDADIRDFSKRVMQRCMEIRKKKTYKLGNSFFKRYRGQHVLKREHLKGMQLRYTSLWDILERTLVEEHFNGSSAQKKYLFGRVEFVLTRIYQIVDDGDVNKIPDMDQLKGLLLEAMKLTRSLLALYDC
ncbi:hypothetical protein L596_021650 [Steinernema carpocapsae]|uniref:RING-type domain-containing protein n=1 Tax=Steinernema carpocapsae TaxID=34508 RepID=A0A4U5MJD2_STECR|nr:hypothetical protein L596_021650 [Steinernema carpocapsae]